MQEIFCDYYPITSTLYSLNIGTCYGSRTSWDGIQLQRCVNGVIALTACLQRRPTIRYDSNSLMTLELAQELQVRTVLNKRMFLAEKDLFDFPRSDTTPILLLLDRRMDLMTPLLMQWTYQAMIHELIGIENGRVKLPMGDIKEVDLSTDRDSFFADHLYSSFGELGVSLKRSVDSLMTERKTQSDLDNAEDVRDYFDLLSKSKEMSAVLERHAAILGHINTLIDNNQLLSTSEYEQFLACYDGYERDHRGLSEILRSESISDEEKTKLLCMYALKYKGKPSEIPRLLETYKRSIKDESHIKVSIALKRLSQHLRNL